MTDSAPATILLVDDHPLLRKGLRQLIELEDELDLYALAFIFSCIAITLYMSVRNIAKQVNKNFNTKLAR